MTMNNNFLPIILGISSPVNTFEHYWIIKSKVFDTFGELYLFTELRIYFFTYTLRKRLNKM